ncbi:MAG: hypothetical protein ACOYVJ_01530 [Nitrospirota bacterium]
MKKTVLLFLSVVLFFSCASAQKNTRSTHPLKQRVEAFYKARMAHDFREAFRYEHLSLTEFTEKQYMTNAAKSPMEYLGAEVLSIDMKEGGEEALVKMQLRYRLMPVPGFEKFEQIQERTLEEKWVFREGNWYHVIKGVTREW